MLSYQLELTKFEERKTQERASAELDCSVQLPDSYSATA